MISNVTRTKRRGIFYGWWVVLIATAAMVLNGGVYFYGFSAFYNPLIREFGWSSAALSGAFSLSRLEAGIAAPVVGFLVDRFGTRLLMICGFTMVGLGFILLSQVNSIEMFYLVFVVLLSGGMSLGFYGPASASVANWFVRKRSLALGIMTCGVGLGGIAVPVMAWFINNYGWRPTVVGIGIIFLLLALPIPLLMRHRPEPYGYLPDGDQPESDAEAPPKSEDQNRTISTSELPRPAKSARPAEVDFTPRQALATSAFWIVSLIFTFRQFVNAGVAVHTIPALENIGFSPEGAASMLAIMMVLSITGRLGFGWLADRYEKRYIIAAGFFLQFLGVLALSFASDIILVIVFLVVYGPAYGGLIPLMPTTYGAFFGRKFFATILGFSTAVTMWGTILGPVLAGYTFDVSGSYQFAFTVFAFANLGGMILLLFVKPPRVKAAVQAITA